MSTDRPVEPTGYGYAPQQVNAWDPGAADMSMPTAGPVYGYAQPPAGGPLGKVRGTGVCILLFVVTLGIYSWIWYFKTHEEMKLHTGQGLGGLIALLLAVFIGAASPFISSSEVGGLYERRGQAKPVTGLTGLWCIPGFLLLVGPIIWFVRTNGALNAYWRSLGAH